MNPTPRGWPRFSSAVVYQDAAAAVEPAVHDYGEGYWSDLSYGALDPEDHVWWITQRLRSPAA